jgi:tetratricopeptide (TPR) repeat protein
MEEVNKTVFISYRRSNVSWALAIYQNLTLHGFDVFFDYTSIKSGSFEEVILQNIKNRSHFLVILTPSALERCSDPNDWVRREIETALVEKRNIVPLFFDGFHFGTPSISKNLTGYLSNIKNYNGISIPAEYFDAAMERLRNDFLNISLQAVIHPVSNITERETENQKLAANSAAKVELKELTAQQWFETGNKLGVEEKYIDALHAFTEAISIQPDFAYAYCHRGIIYSKTNNFESAMKDYNEAIRLQPEYVLAYSAMGLLCINTKDFDGAVKNYNEAIRLNSGDSFLYENYLNRGIAYFENKDIDKAIADFSKSIHLNPSHADTYYARGMSYLKNGNFLLGTKDLAKSKILRG